MDFAENLNFGNDGTKHLIIWYNCKFLLKYKEDYNKIIYKMNFTQKKVKITGYLIIQIYTHLIFTTVMDIIFFMSFFFQIN